MTTPQSGIFALGTAAHSCGSSISLRGAAARILSLLSRHCASRGRRWAASTWSRVSGPSSGQPSFPTTRPRDLTGFIDGSENPTLIDAPEIVAIPQGRPGAGGTVLLLQKWVHDVGAWEALPAADQERVIGRRKLDSVELEDKPADSHVASTDQDRFGKISRRNMPYGTVTDHGTMFVGFSAHQRPLATMLDSMAGIDDGTREALTRYSRPLTGAYYFVPSTDALRRLTVAS